MDVQAMPTTMYQDTSLCTFDANTRHTRQWVESVLQESSIMIFLFIVVCDSASSNLKLIKLLQAMLSKICGMRFDIILVPWQGYLQHVSLQS